MVSKERKKTDTIELPQTFDMDTNKIKNLPIPKKDSEAATKKYVDDITKTLTVEDALRKENGGYNVVGDDAVTKGYVDDREIFTQVEDENPRLNEYLAGENSDVSVYEANGVSTTPYRLGLYQDEFKK